MDVAKKDKLFEVADRQLGYFTSQQAEDCGFPRSHFQRHLASGAWIKEIRGVYRLARYPLQDRSELVLWTLWSRNKKGVPQGVWSHETALDIHELTDIMPSKMHLTVPKHFRRGQEIPQIIHLHFSSLADRDMEMRRGYRVTTPLKTLLDIAAEGFIPLNQIKQGLDEALSRGLLLRRDIEESKTDYPESAETLMKVLDGRAI